MVTQALLEQGGPSLPDALEACRKAGVEQIIVLPAFIPLEVATRNWLRFVARRWLDETGAPVRVVFADSLADHPGTGEAAKELVRQASQRGVSLASIGQNPGTPEPDWSVIPPHNYHVLFCHGPRCAAAGAADLGAFFRKRLSDTGMDEGSGQVLAARTGCLYPCNLGPVMVVYPDGIWYCGLNEAVLDRIIEQHFRNGDPVGEYAFKPSPFPQSQPRPGISIADRSGG
jgi:(2Fe-2S) ferredoxin